MKCYFVSDLHGRIPRYNSLFRTIEANKPKAVFLGGDLMPHQMHHLVKNNGFNVVMKTLLGHNGFFQRIHATDAGAILGISLANVA